MHKASRDSNLVETRPGRLIGRVFLDEVNARRSNFDTPFVMTMLQPENLNQIPEALLTRETMPAAGALVPAGKFKGAQIYEVVGVGGDMRNCNEYDTDARHEERGAVESAVISDRNVLRVGRLVASGISSDQAGAIVDIIEMDIEA